MSINQLIEAHGENVVFRIKGVTGFAGPDGVIHWDKEILYGRPFPYKIPGHCLDGIASDQGWLLWLCVIYGERGPEAYHGLCAVNIKLDILKPIQVSLMRTKSIHLMAQAARGAIAVEECPQPIRAHMAEALRELDSALWERTPGRFKGALL